MGQATYILEIKIYKVKSRRLLELSQSTYIDNMLKKFIMEESNRGYLLTLQGMHLFKDMCPRTPIERDRIERFYILRL
jgi:hypothetical protein